MPDEVVDTDPVQRSIQHDHQLTLSSFVLNTAGQDMRKDALNSRSAHASRFLEQNDSKNSKRGPENS